MIDAPRDPPVDARGLMYSIGYFSAKHLGAGQFYLMTIKDKSGKRLDGANSYVLRVPPDAPVALYWSVTAYDRETHALIRNMDRASRASNADDVQKNADGSVDLYIQKDNPGPDKESNWLPAPAGKFVLMLRMYWPNEKSPSIINGTWKPPPVRRVTSS